eukprot:CAMPEP_0119066868 /NCGR_PEP_ID=MMETSP1178-20130426/9298_1 /TAXON_ID=33656 /ORGANISM="unid sp, Strain CCMP2000" /LENGTH=540 /DNA_ID=CAMNT_0007048497 /DNA_START=283 /DNA_END=1905 /DNA_ORIENTATION=-
MKNALLLARAQLSRGTSFDHHIVLQSCGDSPPSCNLLRAGLLPLEENVTCFDAKDMHRLVPATHRLSQVAVGPHGQGARTVGAYRWCWYSCDAAYLSWFLSTKPEGYTYFWFLEWDVTWTGDLAVVLGAWSTAAPALTGSTPDLLCPNPSKAIRRWPHLHSRNISFIHYNDTFMCVTEVQRMSMRFLKKLAAFALQPEAAMFCEMRAPSVCHIESAWCTMGTLFDSKHQRYLFADQARWINTYTHRISRAAMEASIDRDILWHGYKWDALNGSVDTLYDTQLRQFNTFLAPATAGPGDRLGSPDCKALVPNTVDAPPMRTPQAVHSSLIRHITGKELVEIGTRNGDGMSCFARVARRATAVELSSTYCQKLRERSQQLMLSAGSNFSVDCRAYQQADLDADVITWWAETPILKNWDVLQRLARGVQSGQVRATAEALLIFDPLWPPDLADWRDFGAPLAHWTTNVSFDETDLCWRSHERRLGRLTGARRERLCNRAKGVFHVAAISINSLPRGKRPTAAREQHSGIETKNMSLSSAAREG